MATTNPFTTGGGVAIEGDPVQALAAQVNRINKTALYAPAPGALTRDLASAALLLMQTIAIAAAVSDPYATDQLTELTAAMQNDPVGYVSARIVPITQALAVYGDRLGLPPASVGITKKDPRFKIKWDGWMYTSAIAASLTALIAVTSAAKYLATRRRAAPAPAPAAP